MPSSAKILTITLMLSFAAAGAYGSMITAYLHGFLDALRVCVTGDPAGCVLDMSTSMPPQSWTGIPVVDSQIGLLLEFFAQGVMSHSEKIDLEAFLALTYSATMFGGGWYLMAMEGFRRGSSGTILSWTGVFGLVFQAVTTNIITPLYFILQLLLDPASSNSAAALPESTTLEFLPLSTLLCFVGPTIGIGLPMLNVLSKGASYKAIAFWQPFPLYHVVVHAIICTVFGRGEGGNGGQSAAQRQKKAVDGAYRFILGFTMTVHLLVVGTIAASFVLGTPETMSPKDILGLTALSQPPTLALLNPPVSAPSARAIVSSFLRWDVYGTCASLTVWAVYQWQAVQETSRLAVALFKTAFWAVLGGPVAPAILLMWERDSAVLEKSSRPKKAKKTKKTQ